MCANQPVGGLRTTLTMDRNLPASVIAARMGMRVRARRLETKLRLEDLANAIGRSQAEVLAIEEGRQSLSAREIVALCRVLEVRPSWFFDDLL